MALPEDVQLPADTKIVMMAGIYSLSSQWQKGVGRIFTVILDDPVAGSVFVKERVGRADNGHWPRHVFMLPAPLLDHQAYDEAMRAQEAWEEINGITS